MLLITACSFKERATACKAVLWTVIPGLRLTLTCILATQRMRLTDSAAGRRRRGMPWPPGSPLCILPPWPRRRSRRLASRIAKDLSAWRMTLSVREQDCSPKHGR
jgi:hypothetical protein